MPTIEINFNTRFAQNLDSETIYITGLIVRRWSMIEFAIDSSIRDFLNRSNHKQKDSSLKINLKNRLNLLAELYQSDKGASPEFDIILTAIRRLEFTRNVVTHGLVVTDQKRPKTHIYVSRTSWSAKPAVNRQFILKTTLFERAEKIAQTFMCLFTATAGCHDPNWQPYFDKSLLRGLAR